MKNGFAQEGQGTGQENRKNMKLWQVKWFKIGVLIVSGLLAVGLTFVIIFIHQNSSSNSPTPSLEIETSPPLPQENLPEPKTLGVAIKSESADPIFMYHHIQDVAGSANSTERNLSLSPKKFREEMKYLSDSGYAAATLAELFNDVPEKRVVLTFDDGYQDLVDNALPAMKEFGFRGVVFVIADNIGKPGYVTWGELKQLKELGWEIGSHSLTHPDLERELEAVQMKQIYDSKKILEEKLGVKVDYFCYPAGKYNETTISLLKEAGYLGAVTVNLGTNNSKKDIFELKRIRIVSTESLTSFKSKVNPVK
jgi:peptidoglycan/xylan/chitin deacetylase (PgdA/CDA1 family)